MDAPSLKTLLHPEAALRAIAAGTSDVIIVRDLEGRYIFANEAAAAAHGVSVAEMLGRDHTAYFPIDVARQLADADRKIVESGETVTVVRDLPIQGGLRTYHVIEGPCRDAGGQTFGVFVISRDFTEHQRQGRERTKLLERECAARAMAEQARAEAESSARALRSLERITEAALSSLEPEQLLQTVVARIQEAFAADTVAVALLEDGGRELVLHAAYGLDEALAEGLRFPATLGVAGRILTERRPVILADLTDIPHVCPFIRDHVTAVLGAPLRLHDGVLGVIHVGTVERRSFTEEERALIQLAADRIALALEHARLYESVREANRVRDELLRVVAHDLRSPLNGIVLSASVLLRHAQKGVSNDGVPAQAILASAEQMNHLIQDLLDVTRIERGELALERAPVDVAALVLEAAELNRPAALARNLQLESWTEGAGSAVVDRHRILQVLSNLLGNAIKFTEPGGRIRLGAAMREREVWLSVADTGPGIHPDHVPHVFERFWRADRNDRRGLGLGLSIARGIVLRHGGQIELESQVGKGTTFHVRLPIDGN